MAKSCFVGSSALFGTGGYSDNATYFLSLTANFSQGGQAETNLEIPVRDAGTFSNLFCYVTSNTTLVTSTLTVRKSVSDTSVTVNYTSGQTGVKEDTSNSFSVANTDEVNYKLVVPNDVSGSTAINIKVTGIQFDPTTTTDCVSFLGSASFLVISTASTNFFSLPSGQIANSGTTESEVKYRARFAFTSSNLWCSLSLNTRTTDTTLKTRKNGADGGQLITYTSLQTGSKEDTSNTDSLSIGDDFNYVFTTSTGTDSFRPLICGTRCISTSNIFPFISGISNSSVSFVFNATEYVPLTGFLSTSLSSEVQAQYLPRFDFTAKELLGYVTANTIATSASTVTLRDNGADSSVVVSYAAAETGLKNDTSNSATITGGTDEINYKVLTPNTSGTLSLRWVGVLGETASAASTFLPPQIIMF